MKTREIAKVAGIRSASPLAQIKDEIVGRVSAAEALRMAEARSKQAMRGGAGPLLSSLQKRLAAHAAERLINNAAPAITRADLHRVLKTASDAQPSDRGLKRATTHAYRLFTTAPEGTLSVGDVARLREHYRTEFPRSKVASVIDVDVPKAGFNTLPLTDLTRIAAQIQRAGGDQRAYEEGVRQFGLDAQTVHAFRCRAFVRSLIDGSAEPETSERPGLAQRVKARLATDSDPLLSKYAQLDMDMDMDEGGLFDDDDAEAFVEEVELDSPLTGEPLMIEVSEGESEPEFDEPSAPLPVDEGMEVLGQLEDFGAESTTVITDPTDPEGGELELTVRPLDDAGPMPEEDMPGLDMVPDEDEPPLEMEGAHEPKCGMEHEHSEACYDSRSAMRRFEAFATIDGRMSNTPIDRFYAPGMAAALKRIASQGVRGNVLGNPSRLASEATIELPNGNFITVVAKAAPELQGKNEAFTPKIVDQQEDQMPGVPDDGTQILVGDKTMGKGRKADLVDAVVDGGVAKRAGWELLVNDDAEVELRYKGKAKKTASMMDIDDLADEFITSSAPKPVPQLRYAALQHEGTGAYVVVTDIPGDDAEARKFNAKRILAAVQRHVPAARGTLRKDAKLQLQLTADAAGLGRVRRILEDQYRVAEFQVEAQITDMPPSPGSAAQEGLVQPTPTDPMQLTQNPAVATGTVIEPPTGATGAPMGGGQPTAPPQQSPVGEQTYVGPPQQMQAAFTVHYVDNAGNAGAAPVQARTASAAQSIFERFNGDTCRVTRVAQMELAAPDMTAPAPDLSGGEVPPELTQVTPGARTPMHADQSGELSAEEEDAVRAALMHYRNLGFGPMTALDQLSSQYRQMLEHHGDKTDLQRHMIEASIMRVAAEIWQAPAQVPRQANKAAPRKAAVALRQFALRSAQAMPQPAVNNQQADAVATPPDLGRDSETDDTVTNAIEAPKINSQVPAQSQSGTSQAEGTLGKDTETNDPGNFGASKPQAHSDRQTNQGESFSPTSGPAGGLGADTETGPHTKAFDSASAKAKA